MTLIDFLFARIAEDEQRYDDVMYYTNPDGSRIRPRVEPGEDVEEVKARTFRRELAECAAKRRIVEDARDYSPALEFGDDGAWAFDRVTRALAMPYADHPEYDPSWAVG